VPPRGLRRWLLPYLGTIIFLAHVVISLARPGDALKDPGVGWHLRAGQLILDARAVPRVDAFSFTAAGRPWIDYYWLWELVSAAVERVGGLPLVATVWMLAYACIPLVLYRNAIRSGSNPLAALLVLASAETALLSHAITRPHVVTYLFFAMLVGRLADVEAGRGDVRRVWWLPLLAAVWANAHGGFIAGLAAVAVMATAAGARSFVDGDPQARRGALVLGGLLVAMALATLATPYGVDLHRQAIEHLAQPSTGRFAEFRSPDFRAGGAAIGAFEAMVIALLVLAGTGYARASWGTLALVAGTLHMALTAARNVNLFVIVATPIVATALTRVLASRWPSVDARWQAIAAEQEASPGWQLYVGATAIVCMALATNGRLPFPTTLDGLQLSRGAAAHIRADPEPFARAFNTDGLGGTLIYDFWPRLRVFVDDRTPVYGERFMQEYFTVFDARVGWNEVLERHGVTAAIVATGTSIYPALLASPAWKVAFADAQTAIFVKIPD
jgi:hypothetical protein